MKYLIFLLLFTSCVEFTPVKRANTDKYVGKTIESFSKTFKRMSIRFTDGDSLVIVGGGADAACYFGIQ
jgi:hypothetical protein